MAAVGFATAAIGFGLTAVAGMTAAVGFEAAATARMIAANAGMMAGIGFAVAAVAAVAEPSGFTVKRPANRKIIAELELAPAFF